MHAAFWVDDIIRERVQRFRVTVSILQRDFNKDLFHLFFYVKNIFVFWLVVLIQVADITFYAAFKIKLIIRNGQLKSSRVFWLFLPSGVHQ